MTVLGLLFATVGQDLETGSERLTFGLPELSDGNELVALALGLFVIGEFMNSVNQVATVNTKYTNVRLSAARRTRCAGMYRLSSASSRGTRARFCGCRR